MADDIKVKIKNLPKKSSVTKEDIFIESNGIETYRVTADDIVLYAANSDTMENKYIGQSSIGVKNGIAPLNSSSKINGQYIVYGNTNSTAYEGSAGAILEENLDAHILDGNNPHNTTKSQVGLPNVDNTSDIDKPVSTAQQAAIDLAYKNATGYTDQVKSDIMGGMPESTLDTIVELGEALKDSGDALTAVIETLGSKADKSKTDTHIGNDGIHVTTANKSNWADAYTHSQSAHAPSNAQANQNAFSKIAVGSTTIEANNVTDTLTLVAGSNITITTDSTNDKLTITAKDTVYSHPSNTEYSNGLYKITVDTLGHVTSAVAVSKTDITNLGIPSADTNTHYASKNVVGSSTATSNTTTALENGNVYLLSVENGVVTSAHQIRGTGGCTVTTDTSGNILINGANTYTLPTATDSVLGGVKTGANITNTSGVISLTKDNVVTALGYTPGTGSSNPITVDSELSSTSTNPIENRAVYAALEDKSHFSSTPINGRVVITDGTGGAIKSSGYTLAASVPSDAKFTDTVYAHPTTDGNKHIPSGGSSGQILRWSSAGTAAWGADNNSDTKDTAGSTNSSSKLFLVGATSQAANPKTYSHDTVYVGVDGCLYSNNRRVIDERIATTEPTNQITNDRWLKEF